MHIWARRSRSWCSSRGGSVRRGVAAEEDPSHDGGPGGDSGTSVFSFVK